MLILVLTLQATQILVRTAAILNPLRPMKTSLLKRYSKISQVGGLLGVPERLSQGVERLRTTVVSTEKTVVLRLLGRNLNLRVGGYGSWFELAVFE